MEYAVSKLKAEVLMEFDADFSHDPQKIPAFLTKIDAGYDMVLGSRYIKGGTIPANWGIHRKFLSFFGNWLIRIVMTNFRIHDWTTGYRAIRKEVYEAVKDDLNQDRFFGYTFQIGFLHKAVRKGFKITEEPIHFIDRTRGESKLGTEYIKNTLLYIFKARWLELTSWRFFKFAVVGGTGFLLQTLIFEVVGVWGKLTTPTVATVIGGQAAIISNFLINNVWTFRDKTISEPLAVAVKFGQFWLTSNLAVVVIQGGSVRVGEGLVGPGHLLIQGFYLSGIFLTLIWNYTIYNRFIWRTDKY
ncbi:hypothetical protein A2783_03985 [Microgenomates group bacterium RIFCSPHIGHO2_01_FULL_45_11]|nr:MAG: hypothetical protein A2783_03985 [Microgenomates group bacterium RIFCSPHIGHO2_01_FULL_45_11]